MQLIQIYDAGVAQYAYIFGCENTGEAIVIDPQRNIAEYLKIAEEKNEIEEGLKKLAKAHLF